MVINISQSDFVEKLLNEELIRKIEKADCEFLKPTEKFLEWFDEEGIPYKFVKKYTGSIYLDYFNKIKAYDLLLEVDENDLTKILLRWI